MPSQVWLEIVEYSRYFEGNLVDELDLVDNFGYLDPGSSDMEPARKFYYWGSWIRGQTMSLTMVVYGGIYVSIMVAYDDHFQAG